MFVRDMSETFTKLFSSITRSSIWLEDDQTLRVWVTMLALADRNGYVGASVGGLAALARVPRDKTQDALDKFLSPDEDSRSKDFDGRRIEVSDRGWNILNYQRFRDMRDEEARKEYERLRKRAQRSKDVPDKSGLSRNVPIGPEMSRVSAHAEAHAEAEAEEKSSLPTVEKTATTVATPRVRDKALDALKAAMTASFDVPPAITQGNARKVAARLRSAVEAGKASDLSVAALDLVRAAKATERGFPWALFDADPYAAPKPVVRGGRMAPAPGTTAKDFEHCDDIETQMRKQGLIA